jgi:hypothetical protein
VLLSLNCTTASGVGYSATMRPCVHYIPFGGNFLHWRADKSKCKDKCESESNVNYPTLNSQKETRKRRAF